MTRVDPLLTAQHPAASRSPLRHVHPGLRQPQIPTRQREMARLPRLWLRGAWQRVPISRPGASVHARHDDGADRSGVETQAFAVRFGAALGSQQAGELSHLPQVQQGIFRGAPRGAVGAHGCVLGVTLARLWPLDLLIVCVCVCVVVCVCVTKRERERSVDVYKQ